ncbi:MULTISPECIES: ATP synthase F1 subunit gamma [Ruminococcus]|uniref:ATP synthase gamma chain n=1 Tax=Ruminococcus albus (strain ATCC 27210 / DSM 20455 / JCM 14654 / NCDO 2250 / 7) TaxID=697329 RepID=ATPG_RUMA7|nr:MULTISPECIES: ATP synthase F1 subunit gamma [Ruminococcus]O50141.1 RecName: Full=ATP synthase gamma chain; AltName: Full=ATP synthase F1 sector gamma subunit; AltName: Full=F-ATPase gamma subunit [Ruminococcus albus 7 = DSM 20455]ADU20849.1 ATP synthase F1, gamma subunit [Ruminococcus albus 7 = DSM 20455]MCR5022463.1 ATP synthase F1 subunit gamma [Ruminococcus sp.]BAA23687.1 proton-translocating ATPase, gamma subunit [Ruminococcus albus 7 = DSM 20455]
MANMKDVKRRIKSVESTMQITKAMQLVASSKMRKAKERAEAVHPFFEGVFQVMADISRDHEFTSVFTKKKFKNSVLLIVIAGDRGLAGGFNTNVLKLAKAKADAITESGGEAVIMAIGKKAVEYFEKREYKLIDGFPQIAEGIELIDAMMIANKVIERFKIGDFDAVELVYTTFVSVMTQEPQHLRILPVENLEYLGQKHPMTIYDPSPEEVFDSLIPEYMGGMLYSAIVDSFASEQAARRTAMESASDNANEMIEKLSLLYNRARQAQITQEITEISSASLNDNS